ncbi:Aim29p NDAI_0F00650 [Naumovozyma dairenensis CBS 421]|uniref:Altered inheritance rate of mitochondria protein 29 n=1 Tax=Naumovozyma dairenensis (strain ATCC 10597 / BCRC 20456 / CBS 421 / NBRC 0211 / NRRL Y-12639) TaxID=1071378 RepID=G0WC73_NAUDC|nr:hypothetical protein NDAI_0F00650 [Naumovozyma dairenensis CBS 421]CCD25384.1 hypothetical protein NDAI_0F00650 [Naumovozyma dairenensis CBS 421]
MTNATHPIDYDLEEPLTSNARPLTNVTLTIRLIKSFPYRNVKNIILQNYNLETKTAHDLFEDVLKRVQTEGSLRPYRNVNYDTMKIYTHAHKSKTINLVINFDHDEDWTLDVENANGKKLSEYDIENETEISLFNNKDYIEFKANPIEKWL